MTAIAVPPRRWRWPAELTTPRKARQATRAALTSWQLDTIADDAVQLVSEVVANACMHGGGKRVRMVLRRTERGVRCRVADSGHSFPLRSSYAPERGLGIVLALARDVRVSFSRRGGKCVCFDLDDTRSA